MIHHSWFSLGQVREDGINFNNFSWDGNEPSHFDSSVLRQAIFVIITSDYFEVRYE